MRLRYTAKARVQLTAARDYIRIRNPIAARNFLNKAARRLRQLTIFPGIGHIIPEAPDGVHRQIVVAQYRFFYRLEGDTVLIVAVWHGKQTPTLPSIR
jgi:plasmid stabilization system protein ParE